MKILFVHHCAIPGGASTSLVHLLQQLSKDDRLEIHVICPKGTVAGILRPWVKSVYELTTTSVSSFMPSAEGIPFILPKSMIGYLRYFPSLAQIRRLVKQIQPDLVHINDVPLLPSAVQIGKMDYPVVMHARTAPGRHQGLADKWQRRQINKYVDRLICISESVKKGYHDIYRCCVVYNPAHVERGGLTPVPARKGTELRCVFLSNLLPYKGIYETMEAALLLKDHHDIHIYIAGDDIRPPEHYKTFTGKLLSRLGIRPQIRKWMEEFITKHNLKNVTLLGHVRDIGSMLSTMHVNLAPMRLNSPPRSVFEAAVYGVPTILALEDVVEDMIQHGETGFIIPPRNPQALADAILRLYHDDELRVSMGETCRDQLIAQHDPTSVAAKTREIYREVIERRRHS